MSLFIWALLPFVALYASGDACADCEAYQECEDQLAALQADYESLQDQNEDLRAQIQEYESLINSLREQNEALPEVPEEDADIDQILEGIATLNGEELPEGEADVEDIEAEIEQLTEEIVQEIAQNVEEPEEIPEEVAEIKAQLEGEGIDIPETETLESAEVPNYKVTFSDNVSDTTLPDEEEAEEIISETLVINTVSEDLDGFDEEALEEALQQNEEEIRDVYNSLSAEVKVPSSSTQDSYSSSILPQAVAEDDLKVKYISEDEVQLDDYLSEFEPGQISSSAYEEEQQIRAGLQYTAEELGTVSVDPSSYNTYSNMTINFAGRNATGIEFKVPEMDEQNTEELKAELQEASKSLTENEITLESMTKTIEQNEDSLEDLQSENSALYEELEKTQAKNEELNEEIRELSKMLKQIKAEVEGRVYVEEDEEDSGEESEDEEGYTFKVIKRDESAYYEHVTTEEEEQALEVADALDECDCSLIAEYQEKIDELTGEIKQNALVSIQLKEFESICPRMEEKLETLRSKGRDYKLAVEKYLSVDMFLIYIQELLSEKDQYCAGLSTAEDKGVSSFLQLRVRSQARSKSSSSSDWNISYNEIYSDPDISHIRHQLRKSVEKLRVFKAKDAEDCYERLNRYQKDYIKFYKETDKYFQDQMSAVLSEYDSLVDTMLLESPYCEDTQYLEVEFRLEGMS
jgi:chromosome segregation ATPase